MQISVVATDGGVPQQSAVTTVKVTIARNFAPVINFPLNNAVIDNVPEDVSTSTTIVDVDATDANAQVSTGNSNVLLLSQVVFAAKVMHKRGIEKLCQKQE